MEPEIAYEIVGDADLNGGILVIALDGWIDAGMGAATAMAALMGSTSASSAVVFSDDPIIDHRARRPLVELVDGETRGLKWPTVELMVGHDREGRKLGMLVGPEPDLFWRPFGRTVADLARKVGVGRSVGLGAFPAATPHTRPVRVAATSPVAEVARGIGVVPGSMEVPAGLGSVLELELNQAGIPSLSLWARVPHYVAAMPYPGASAALLDMLSTVTGLALDSSPLHTAADATNQKVNELILPSEEHREMVSHLEMHLDAAEGNPLDVTELPSGDQLAAELERFLRGDS